MTGRRTALLVVTDTHVDPTFGALRAPRTDADALAAVLRDPRIGGYAVETLVNRPADEVRRRLNRLFGEAEREDMVLCYVSGHGVKDEAGRLHLVTTDTEHQYLPTTAVGAGLLRELIDGSRARRTALWLDCCYSGAFPSGRVAKATGTVDVVAQLTAQSGRGCAVMTASTAIQYAFERGVDPHVTGSAQPSVFTDAIVRGLRTGAADLNADGLIDANELYLYVHDEVKRSTPDQTPTRNDQLVGDLYIAYSNRGLPLDPALPQEIRQGLRSTMPRIRQAAVDELAELAASGNDIARDALAQLSKHVEGDLAQLASAALGQAPVVTPVPKNGPPDPPVVEPPSIPLPIAAERTRHMIKEAIARQSGQEPPPRSILQWPEGVPSLNRAGARPLRRIFDALDLSTTLANDLGEPESVAFSPDSSALVVVDRGGLLHWSTSTWDGRLLRGDGKGYLKRALFNPKGDLLAAVSEAGVHLWRTDTWQPWAVLGVPGLRAVAFSPDGRHLVTVPDNDVLRVWRTSDWQQVAQTSITERHFVWAGAAYSADSTMIAVTWGPSILIWYPPGEPVCLDVEKKTEGFRSLAFSPDGTLLAAGSGAGVVVVWNTSDWSVHARLRGHKENVIAMAFSPDGRTLATGGVDNKIRLWDPAAGGPIKTLTGHFWWVTSLAFSPDGTMLASAGRDGMVKLWPVRELTR